MTEHLQHSPITEQPIVGWVVQSIPRLKEAVGKRGRPAAPVREPEQLPGPERARIAQGRANQEE